MSGVADGCMWRRFGKGSTLRDLAMKELEDALARPCPTRCSLEGSFAPGDARYTLDVLLSPLPDSAFSSRVQSKLHKFDRPEALNNLDSDSKMLLLGNNGMVLHQSWAVCSSSS